MQDDLPYCETGFFSELVLDYLEKNEKLADFYSKFPTIENFKPQIEAKKAHFSVHQRKELQAYFKQQYKLVEPHPKSLEQINKLVEPNSFTVTTGHQLNLFTGPLYFIYKIISAINLCQSLKQAYPEHNFVPIYWMATEDHDFDEISFFHHQGEKNIWKQDEDGAVGRIKTASLHQLVDDFCEELGESEAALKLKEVLIKAYKYHTTLAEATFYLVHQLFADEGLLIIDADHVKLKQQAIPIFEADLIKHKAFNHVTTTSQQLYSKGYKLQVNPREINLFYLKDDLRERIIRDEDKFLVVDTSISFSEEELKAELHKHPERFSPNVILRPLFQELILPNLCYIGGGGELAYWFQLKSFFEASAVDFPILLLRNSALLYTNKQHKKIKKLNLTLTDLFLDAASFESKITHQISKVKIDFSKQQLFLEKQFEDLYLLAEQTDASFIGAVAAQEQKQKNGLAHLEKRLLKAQKRKHKDYLKRANQLRLDLFPGDLLQERHDNFIHYYIESQGELIQLLKSQFKPLQLKFNLVQYA